MRNSGRMADELPTFGDKLSAKSRLGQLYGTHAPDAYRLAYLLTGDKEVAADIMQDAFVRLFGRFADLRDISSFSAYLRRTVVNLVTDRFRRVKAEQAYALRRAPHENEVGDMPDVETREVIGRALHRLPARQRAALVLRFYEDLTERQTAEILNCSVAAVKGLVSRGLSGIRDLAGRETWT